MYAIIESCGKQYKVAEGDVVFFEKLEAEERDIKRQIDTLNKEQSKIEDEQKKLEREKAELNS